MEEFLQGAHDIDCHYRDAPFQDNIPVLMGLLRCERGSRSDGAVQRRVF
jgi:glucose-6-phosphate isomerase